MKAFRPIAICAAGLSLVVAVITAAPARQEKDRLAVDSACKEAEQLAATQIAESRRRAIDRFDECVSLRHASGDRAGEATALFQIGVIYRALADNNRAFDYAERALDLRRSVGSGGTGEILSLIGAIQLTFGDTGKALDAYNEAVAASKASNESQAEAVALNGRGLLYVQLAEYQKAADSFNEVLPITRVAGDAAGEARALANIGLIRQLTGNFQDALESYRSALTRFQALGNRASEASALLNIGTIYGTLGEGRKALDEFYSKALALYHTLGNGRQEGFTLNSMGSAYLAQGEYRKAAELYNQALPLMRAANDRSGEARTLHNFADLSALTGQRQQALDQANQALTLFQSAGDVHGEATVRVQIGSIQQALNAPDKALEAYNVALPLTRNLKDAGGEARVLAGMARIDRDAGNLDSARNHMEAALSVLESVRSSVAIQELRATYFASTRREYEYYIDLSMQLHKQRPASGFDSLAFQASERARARSLLELLVEGHADIRQGADPALLAHERELQQRLTSIAERYTTLLSDPAKTAQTTAAKKEIDGLTANLDEISGQIRRTSPRYAALMQPQPLDLHDIQQQVLDPNTLLLEYALGEERSYLWAVTPTSIVTRELPARGIIEAQARELYNLLKTRPRSPGDSARYRSVAAAMSKMVLDPVASELRTKRLLIVSDGALQYLPFGALPAPSGKDLPSATLQSKHEIVYMPSASTIAVMRRELAGRKPAAKPVAVLADPVFDRGDSRVTPASKDKPAAGQRVAVREDAPASLSRLVFSRKEADAIQAAAPSGQVTQFLGFQANRETAVSPILRNYRIVHFATHGQLDDRNPALSGLFLSLVDPQGAPLDGFLGLHDLYNLNLPAELVVLSACQTALGEDVRGEGLVGLTRGFMYAGAARVVASLWEVDDAGTAEFMKLFYSGMLGPQRLSPAAALRGAQIAMSRQKLYESPYYWAAFVLQGDWRGW